MGRRPPRRAVGALPRTSPGGKPPETPAPFPWNLDYTERRRFVKGSQAGGDAALDKSPPLRRVSYEEGKGASIRGEPPVGRRKTLFLAGRFAARIGAHEALPHTSPGGKPPETPRLYLTRTGLLMEAATVRERYARRYSATLPAAETLA